MKEIDFYPEISEKFKEYLLSYLPPNTQIEFSYNKPLPKMIEEIENKLNYKSHLSDKYIPALQLDILLGVLIPNKEIQFILFEVKYSHQLSLANFSQLVGYLQVAKEIKYGISLLVTKNPSSNILSNDFAEIILMKKLPMKWTLQIDEDFTQKQYEFETGICYLVPNNGIDWKNTEDICGIYSFENLSEKLLSEY